MSLANRPASQRRVMGPTGVASDRRNRRHLRELCDEVLASYRIAAGEDLFSDTDRSDARSLMSTIAPTRGSRIA
jgi:hypothetical protein